MRSLTHKFIRLSLDAPVRDAVHRLRVLPPVAMPTPQGLQRVQAEAWRCHPTPDAWRESVDEHGNRVLELEHARLDGEWRFELCLETERTDCTADSTSPTGGEWMPSAGCDRGRRVEEVAESLRRHLGWLDVSPQCYGEHAIRIAREVCAWTHRYLRYESSVQGATGGASEALKAGAGACGEYSHVMIALCRQLGVASRYVSGYSPHDGLMHAWVEAWQGRCWAAWDPTHDREMDSCDTHIVVARGRDWRDVVPLAGAGAGRLEVFCRSRVTRNE